MNLFPRSSYHPLYWNCNHFSDALLRFLVNGSIPDWINRAARFASGVGMLCFSLTHIFYSIISEKQFCYFDYYLIIFLLAVVLPGFLMPNLGAPPQEVAENQRSTPFSTPFSLSFTPSSYLFLPKNPFLFLFLFLFFVHIFSGRKKAFFSSNN